LVRKEPRPSEIAAAQIKEWRKERGITTEKLSERITALGGRVGRVAITKIEKGQRGLSLDDALLFAAALNVPPAVLWFGLGTVDRVHITPLSEIHPDLAARWLAGEIPLASSERIQMGRAEWEETWKRAARSLQLYKTLRQAQDAAHRADSKRRQAEYGGDPHEVHEARVRFLERLRKLAKVLDEMRDEEIATPKLDAAWAAELKKLDEAGRG
jgi:transcriptional regulator with XRE-family HTH domain